MPSRPSDVEQIHQLNQAFARVHQPQNIQTLHGPGRPSFDARRRPGGVVIDGCWGVHRSIDPFLGAVGPRIIGGCEKAAADRPGLA